MGPRRSRLALLLTVLTAVFRAGSSACSSQPSSCPAGTASPSPIDCVVADFFSATPFICNGAKDRLLYIQRAGGGAWTYDTGAASIEKVVCDGPSAQWQAVDDSGTPTPIGLQDNVVCAMSNPAPTSCDSQRAPSICSSIPGGDGVDCEAVTFASGNHLTCPTSWKALFVISAGSWELKNFVECNTVTGDWESVKQLEKKALDPTDQVICATKNPGASDECPRLNTVCEPGWSLNGVDCKPPFELGASAPTSFNCLQGLELYFKHTATTEKLQKAVSIACKAGKWEIEYKFGEVLSAPLTEELKAGDHLICANSNPEPDACSFFKNRPSGFKANEYEFVPPTTVNVEAGKPGKCPDDTAAREIFSPDKNGKMFDVLSNTFPPVCKRDGQWAYLSGDKYEDWGDKAGCRVKRCKTCQMPDSLSKSMPQINVLPSDLKIERDGKCADMDCVSANNIFALREENDVKYRFHMETVECDTDEFGGLQWVYGVNRKKVEELNCIQTVLGYDDNFYHVDLECPPDTEKPAVPGCVKAAVAGGINKELLECPDGKVMLIRKAIRPTEDVFWDQLKSKTIKFDFANKLKWEVDLLGHTDIEYRDYDNTVVCADSNPAVRPTTTTTTTTTAPLEPICELCQKALIDTCHKCDSESIKTVAKDKDTCQVRPVSKDFSLVNDGNSEQIDFLKCKRPVLDDEGRMPDIVWTDKDDKTVRNFTARREKEIKKWNGGQYGIIAGALLIIGGMGFGCVFIYFRMRKKPSVREKKKKERGVTKKYTSANVVRTDAKSAGGSRESGKSREPTKSAAESNLEDAPTLKL